MSVARLRTRREVVRAGGAEVVDDSVAVLDHQRVTRRFREIEVELLDGDEDTLRRLEKALRRAGANGADFTPKLYRVLDLAYPREPVEVPKDAKPAEALALRLREQAIALVSHDPGTTAGERPRGPASASRRDPAAASLPSRCPAAARAGTGRGAPDGAGLARRSARPGARSRRAARPLLG